MKCEVEIVEVKKTGGKYFVKVDTGIGKEKYMFYDEPRMRDIKDRVKDDLEESMRLKDKFEGESFEVEIGEEK